MHFSLDNPGGKMKFLCATSAGTRLVFHAQRSERLPQGVQVADGGQSCKSARFESPPMAEIGMHAIGEDEAATFASLEDQ